MTRVLGGSENQWALEMPPVPLWSNWGRWPSREERLASDEPDDERLPLMSAVAVQNAKYLGFDQMTEKRILDLFTSFHHQVSHSLSWEYEGLLV